MVVEYSRYEIVSRSNCVQVPRKMKIYVFHRSNLRHTAARRAAFYAEYGTERRFSQSKTNFFAEFCHSVGKTYRSRSLSLAESRGIYSRDEYEIVRRRRGLFIDFCLVLAVEFKLVLFKSEFFCDLCYRL